MEAFCQEALPEIRERSFKKWPFKHGSCTSKDMAQAGFYQNSDGTISCYYCFKELEGWESTDVPYEEHKKHAPYCCFIQTFDEAPENLTLEQVCKLEIGRLERKMEMKQAEVLQAIDGSFNLIVESIPKQEKKGRRRIVK